MHLATITVSPRGRVRARVLGAAHSRADGRPVYGRGRLVAGAPAELTMAGAISDAIARARRCSPYACQRPHRVVQLERVGPDRYVAAVECEP